LMDVGTAKPSIAERQIVRHHLFDLIKPNERFSVAEFQKLAYQKSLRLGSVKSFLFWLVEPAYTLTL